MDDTKDQTPEKAKDGIYFNIITGEVRETSVDSDTVWKTEVPVTQYPKSSCKRCHGRGYIGRHAKLNYYHICRCLIKHVDHSVPKKVTV